MTRHFILAPLFHQLFANQLQFPLVFRAGLWIGQFERLERVENDLGNDQPRILFVVGGNDIPGRIARTGSTQAFFIGLHVLFPEFPLLDIREAELPVLVGRIDALEESLALFLFRKVQEELDDPRAVAVEMFLHVHDGAIALLPDGFLIRQPIRNTLGLQNLRMHANDQHLLVIGSVEDADPPALRQSQRGAPQKIMFQFVCGRMLEAENLAALWIDAGHHVPDGTVLPGGVHRLKYQQHRITVGCVVRLLLRTQFLYLLSEEFLIFFLRLIYWLHLWLLLVEVYFIAL